MDPDSLPRVTVIVPCLNEMDSIDPMISRLLAAEQPDRFSIELLFVDDGSDDQTLFRIREAATRDPRIGYLSFSRTFGKEAAMLAGMRAAEGDLIVIMDGDLQHPPELVPRLVDEHLRTEADQVIALRDRASEPRTRRWASRVFYRVVNRAIEVDLVDGEGDFRLLTRRARDAMLELSEVNRFSKGLFAWIGYPTAVIEYGDRGREGGESSWTFRSLLNYGIEGVVSFNSRPLRTVIHLGWFAVLASIAYFIWLLIVVAREGVDAPGYVTLIGLMVFLGGIQLISVGIIGEYVGRIYAETKHRPHYLISQSRPAVPARETLGREPAELRPSGSGGEQDQVVPDVGGVRPDRG